MASECQWGGGGGVRGREIAGNETRDAVLFSAQLKARPLIIGTEKMKKKSLRASRLLISVMRYLKFVVNKIKEQEQKASMEAEDQVSLFTPHGARGTWLSLTPTENSP